MTISVEVSSLLELFHISNFTNTWDSNMVTYTFLVEMYIVESVNLLTILCNTWMFHQQHNHPGGYQHSITLERMTLIWWQWSDCVVLKYSYGVRLGKFTKRFVFKISLESWSQKQCNIVKAQLPTNHCWYLSIAENWCSLYITPTCWQSALRPTQEAQYLSIVQQCFSSSEGDRVDWDMALFDRCEPRRASIQVLANNLRLHLLVGVITLVLLFAALTLYMLLSCIQRS